MEINWTDEAVAALDGIAAHLSAWSPDRAAEVVKHIIERVESLREMPFSGRMLPEFEQVQLREVIVEHYRVVYRVAASGLVIETIVHGRRTLHDS
ncbi:MAG: type II toxin-antitoxin system RelE/ParE family toxin [Dehalococcoidia bacterium]|nr:type II toxin-antitoxin system RelE/ParE family toxin [Dehalococcoidia bacterium]